MSDTNTVEVTNTGTTDSGEGKEKKTRKQYNVSDKEFVLAWQSSNNAKEVSEKLNMPKNIVLARYAVYKGRGVELKKMERKNPRKLDVGALNELINGKAE